jgi:hypothetical protein
MENICPICQRFFKCKIKYKNIVCPICIKEYGTRTYKGYIIHYYNEKDDFYGEIVDESVPDTYITHNHECVINDTPCYAYLEKTTNVIYYVATINVPVNKLIERVKKMK